MPASDEEHLLVLVGDGPEYDPETEDTDRLAVGLLGEEVRDRWVCAGCKGHGALVFIENYRNRQGSTFALCVKCLWKRLSRTGEA